MIHDQRDRDTHADVIPLDEYLLMSGSERQQADAKSGQGTKE
jgi:hypothetical protein